MSLEFAGFLVTCFSEAVIDVFRGARNLRRLQVDQINGDNFHTLVEEFGFADVSLFQRLKEVQHTCKGHAEAIVKGFVKLENDYVTEDLHARLLHENSLKESIHAQRLSGYDTKENPLIFLFERLAEKQIALARRPPGPLTYNAMASEAQSKAHCSFGSTSPRLGISEKGRATPGPGAYKSLASKKDSGPKWSMGGRAPKHKLDHATI